MLEYFKDEHIALYKEYYDFLIEDNLNFLKFALVNAFFGYGLLFLVLFLAQ